MLRGFRRWCAAPAGGPGWAPRPRWEPGAGCAQALCTPSPLSWRCPCMAGLVPPPHAVFWMRGQMWGSEGLAPHHAALVGTRSWPRSHRPGRAACTLFPCREATWGSCEHDPAECAQEALEAPPTGAGPGLPLQISAGGGSPATGGSERPFTAPHPVLTSTVTGTWRRRTHVPPAPARSLQDGARGAWGNPSASPTDPQARER